MRRRALRFGVARQPGVRVRDRGFGLRGLEGGPADPPDGAGRAVHRERGLLASSEERLILSAIELGQVQVR